MFLGKKLLFIVAHPDDETFTSAGTVFANRRLGGQSAVICATRGERGKSHLKKPHTDRELITMRTKELMGVARFLKLESLHILHFPDGKVSANKKKIYAKCRPLAGRFAPDYIVSFGEDGISGHLDHIAIGEVARRIADSLHIPFVAFAAPPLLRKNKDHLRKRRKFGVYAKRIRHAEHNIKVPVNRKIKLKALRFHKSQFDTKNPKSLFMKSFMSFEYFTAE